MQKISVVQQNGDAVGVLEEEGSASIGVRLDDGSHVAVSREQLEPLADGTVLLKTPLERLALDNAPGISVRAAKTVPVAGAQSETERDSDPRELGASAPQPAESVVIPRLEEQLQIDKSQFLRGSVRVRVAPTEHQQTVSVPVTDVEAEVRRVAIGKIVESAPPVREEGNTVIVPVIEEVLVVEKRLLLREEVHIVRHPKTRIEEHQVTLRSERVEVSRDEE
jgi:uncharacterized protein (TIGR02271 family)